MTDLELERAELRRLERMLEAQKAKVAAMELPTHWYGVDFSAGKDSTCVSVHRTNAHLSVVRLDASGPRSSLLSPQPQWKR